MISRLKNNSNPLGVANQIKRTRCEVYTRVMGYHRPVSAFNQGKKSEYYSRVYFKESKTYNKQFAEEFRE